MKSKIDRLTTRALVAALLLGFSAVAYRICSEGAPSECSFNDNAHYAGCIDAAETSGRR